MENTVAFQEIETAMKKAKDRRMYERYQTLYLYLQGTEVEQIAHIINRNIKTVKGYIKAYTTGGLPGLQMNHSPDASVRLTKEQQEKLKQIIVGSIPQMQYHVARIKPQLSNNRGIVALYNYLQVTSSNDEKLKRA
ncbi:transposase [Paenibacillus terrae HPL-003]|uniref:Transposase n=1 Tax=Paenibacillus terrae (strain HPL-003) TaxID=985665 RepID=G7VQN6_PAETH|nr:helix-turn-helix domain-containing protein [Paenibacillus terrae]AET61225.1 transposase [Paenibacillus terrae HPL-003]